MNAAFSFSRIGSACLGGVLLLLMACDEPENILPGVREDIRPAEQSKDSAVVENTSRSISLGGQTANKDWPQSFGTQTYRVSHAALGSSVQRIWSTQIGQGDSRRQRITASPVVGGGLIYTLDSAAQVSGVTPAGAVSWSVDLTPTSDKQEDATGGGLAYHNGVLYVSSGFGLLTALDAANGQIRWQQELDATGSGQPVVRDGLLYLVAGDDTGWTIHTDDGRIAWQITGTPSVGNVLGAPAPALTSDLAIFAFGSGDLTATFRKGGLRRWTASVAGQRTGRAAALIGDVTGSPVISGNRLFAGNHSGRTVAFDTISGERIWTLKEGALGPVWPAGDSIFLVSDRNQLIRASSSDGTPIWAVDLPGLLDDRSKKRGPIYVHYGPILAGGRIVVASNDGYLRFFKPEDGTLISTTEIPNGASSPPVVAGQTLYVVGSKGQLHAFR
ncbi:PQQ-like beta-propeller repeat protein [Falsiphaeobacter marinintestinus]|uniref:PQQ-like beta-propeller repeat protein n=1 Tax=Falsiphaeobacter marinintestinus TaxID=1492905 RepID=UPI0011B606E6|nr:PQQ-like beta-propeller repeat protein [Phaeobacter marinintestinus]